VTERPDLGPEFEWGVAAAAYQVEGAAREDGKGVSIWDTFAAQPGTILDGSTGEVACDHYHRYPEDVALLHDLGVDNYRFSFAWTRIQPDGSGPVERRGLDFYDRLVDALLEAGITPTPTLLHWDLPQALEDVGGWTARETAHRFADYAALLGEHFADRVPCWMTLNEMVVQTLFGYGVGAHAPGRALLFDAVPVAHHQLLGHGLATQALRAAGATSIGLAANHAPVWSSDDPADIEAARFYDDLHNWLFADPVVLGRYPDGWAEAMPIEGDDLVVISTPVDFYGVNYYCPMQVAAPTGAASTAATDGVALPDGLPFEFRAVSGYPTTDFDWPVVPQALTSLLVTLKERYGDRLPPIFITENGCAVNDGPDAAGNVDDQRRIDFLAAHLAAVAEARERGVDVRGYYQWSITDNFEWAAGYTQRFGLVHVDYATQRRTPKASYHWYRDLIDAHRR
jgi:beta-glucosidase